MNAVVDRKQFLEDRKLYLGASEVAAVLGLSKFATPLDVWMLKTGRAEEDGEPTFEQMVGNAIEPVLLTMVEREFGEPVVRRQESIQHKEAPFMRSTLDGFLSGAKAPVEAKHTFLYASDAGWGEPGTNEVPEIYKVQTQVQMMCSETEHCIIPSLVRLRTVGMYYTEADKDWQDYILETCNTFWTVNVKGDTPPQFSMDHAKANASLRKMYNKVDASSIVNLGNEILPWHEAALQASALANEYTKAAQIAKNHIQRAMGNSAVGILPDGTSYTRKVVKKKAVAMKATEYIKLRHSVKQLEIINEGENV